MSTLKPSRIAETLCIGAFAGMAGGLAEIGWIVLYGAATGTPTEPVARGIVASVVPVLATSSWSTALGVLIHLSLAIALGIGLALVLRLVLRRASGVHSEFGLAMLALIVVWAVNFLAALPRINPAFVHLLPYYVTLLSKLLFGLSAAAVFRADRMYRVRVRVRYSRRESDTRVAVAMRRGNTTGLHNRGWGSAARHLLADLVCRRKDLTRGAACSPAGSGRVGIALALLVVTLVALPWRAHAVPSYTTQTGQPCTSCHQNFPELTPFGRAFKLGGYTLSSGERSFPPISAVAQTNFTHTDAGQPGGAAPDFGPNDNFSLEFASLYYAGKIVDHLGAFSQFTYDGVGRKFVLDHNDIRYANTGSVADNDVTFGVTANDAPTVEDIYNTTTAFGFPFASAALAPSPAAMTLLDSLPFQVGGLGAYAMVNNTVYGAFTLYKTFPKDFQRFAGIKTSTEAEIDAVAPYWRLALQHEWDQHSASVGTFGMVANTFPNRIRSTGTDRFLDVGFDAQYQFRGDPHSASVQASWVHEDQRLSASLPLGLAANASNTLDSAKIKASYLYQDTYGATVSYFSIFGSADMGLFAPAAISGSNNGRPDTSGWHFELDWLPFVKSPLEFAPWAQTKLSLHYILYNSFNGGSRNYDGFGRNASDNDTLFLSATFAF